MKLSILCPTRGRPGNMFRLVESAFETAENPRNLEIIFYMDEDDFESHQALNILRESHLEKVKGAIGPRVVLSEMWNVCYEKSQGDVLMHCGDDIIFRTKCWDSIVLNEFSRVDDRIIFVHGDDGHLKDKFGTHGFLHRNWVETVGYFVPPYFSSDYNDTWLNDVSNELGRRVYVEILTEHMHPNFGKGPLDQTHLDRIERHKKDRVEILYESKKSERDIDCLKLKSFMLECKLNKINAKLEALP